MPKDRDFKRLVRARMDRTGEKYTQARASLAAERGAPDPLVSDRARSFLGQLANTGLAEAARRHLERLPEPERRAAAIDGLRHPDWRVRRTSARSGPEDRTPRRAVRRHPGRADRWGLPSASHVFSAGSCSAGS